jgi:hypothetical protein
MQTKQKIFFFLHALDDEQKWQQHTFCLSVLFRFHQNVFTCSKKSAKKKQVLPGIEPGLPEDTDARSESGVITAT